MPGALGPSHRTRVQLLINTYHPYRVTDFKLPSQLTPALGWTGKSQIP